MASVVLGFHSAVAVRTLHGECRGESDLGKLAVAHVIRNRVASQRWGKTPAAVCLAPYQFSCWLPRDPNFKLLLELQDNDPKLAECIKAWEASQFADDPTHGALHYLVTGTKAKWAEGEDPVVTIGAHSFYVGIR